MPDKPDPNDNTWTVDKVRLSRRSILDKAQGLTRAIDGGLASIPVSAERFEKSMKDKGFAEQMAELKAQAEALLESIDHLTAKPRRRRRREDDAE